MIIRFCSILSIVLMLFSCKNSEVRNELKSDSLRSKMMEGYGQEEVDFGERRGGMPEIKR